MFLTCNLAFLYHPDIKNNKRKNIILGVSVVAAVFQNSKDRLEVFNR